ncbi:MAG TPA: hypothetical protein VJS13_07860 [Pyrinomonadaceae bacterium]|nr:hypothetical protein [Pyrinomonadaceae bacterium]
MAGTGRSSTGLKPGVNEKGTAKLHTGENGFMKKDGAEEQNHLRPEYYFSKLKGHIRGKYVERYREGTKLVLLDPDVAAAFPDAKAVNNALRLLLHNKQD